MNARNTVVFSGLAGQARHFSERVAAICAKYEEELAMAKREAEDRKDPATYLEPRKSELRRKAQLELTNSSSSFATSVRQAVKELNGELIKSYSEPVDADLLDQLRAVKEFGIRPTRSMVETWLTRNGGNLLGLSAIGNVVRDSGAKFVLEYDAPERFERDLESLERLADNVYMYGPKTAHSALCDVWDGEPRTITRPDGTEVKTGDTWNSVALITRRMEVESVLNSLSGMGERWAGGVTYRLADQVSAALAEENDEAPIEPTPSARIADPDAAIEMAQAISAERAAANSRAAESLRHYIK